MVVAKRQGKEKPVKNRTKEGLRTGVRTSGRTYSTPGQPNLQRAGPGGGGKTYKKRSQNWAKASLLFTSFGSAFPHALRTYFPLLSK